MATRSVSPIHTPEIISDDKDRQIRKLKTGLAPLKQKLQQLPLLEQKLLHLNDRCSALQRQTAISQGEYRLREESALRAQQDLNENIILFKKEQKEVQLRLNDVRTNNETLRVQSDIAENQLIELKDLTENLHERGKDLEIEAGRLRTIQKKLQEENLKAIHKSESLCVQNDEITLRTAECKGKTHEMITNKKIYIEKIHQFEDDNNQLDAKVSGNQEVHQSVIVTLKKQETVLALEQEREIELDTLADKLSSDLNHIKSNLRLEQEVTVDLNNQIKSAQKQLIDYKSRIIKTDQERDDIGNENESILKINYQFKKDWDACESHLENLITQNKLLNAQLEKYIKEDDFVMKIIMQRRNKPVITDYVLKSSRVTEL